jgi:hypothetical protein
MRVCDSAVLVDELELLDEDGGHVEGWMEEGCGDEAF